ncbi:MAG TPA: hypothetical protein VF174_08915 [Micromonosporaceae bacterium]
MSTDVELYRIPAEQIGSGKRRGEEFVIRGEWYIVEGYDLARDQYVARKLT